MHHYGEAAVQVSISQDSFKIVLSNHLTGAEITVAGPVQGVFENKEKAIDQMTAERLGNEFAHVARQILSEA
jgi:hypothetical protein